MYYSIETIVCIVIFLATLTVISNSLNNIDWYFHEEIIMAKVMYINDYTNHGTVTPGIMITANEFDGILCDKNTIAIIKRINNNKVQYVKAC